MARAKTRSPNYPAIPLSEAIALAKKLWEKERRTTVSPEVVAKAWGFDVGKRLSGFARTRLGAVRKYGLLDESTGGVKVSERTLRLVQYPPESGEYREELRKAALEPPIFRELYASHRESSDDALRIYLMVKKNFSDIGAKTFIKAFRDTLALANLSEGDYSPSADPEGTREMADDTAEREKKPPFSAPLRDRAGKQRITVYNGICGKSTAEIYLTGEFPEGITAAHLATLRKLLQSQEETLQAEAD